MKVSFLLIILGFSQVLGRNYEPLTESKAKKGDQLDLAPSDIVKPKYVCRARFCGDPEGRAKFLKKLTSGKFSILVVKSLLLFKAKLFQEATFLLT